MSPAQSKPQADATADQPGFPKMLYRTMLYRTWITAVLLSALMPFGATLAAQDNRPLVVPYDRRLPTKKDTGPRAIGVLQVTAANKTSLVPIAIMINGKFWDATVYKADPVPMALESGTVYEVERDGRSVGLFTVGGALRSNAANAESRWLGTGSYLASSTDVDKGPMLKAEAVPVGIDAGDEPPRLTKNPEASKAAPSASTPPSGTSSTAPPPSSKSSDDGPPRLTKSAPTSSDSSQPNSSPPAASDESKESKADPAKSGDAKSSDAKSADSKPAAPPTPASDSGASQSARPRLRRGIPAGPAPEEDIPGYSRFNAKPSTTAPATTPAATTPPGTTPAATVLTKPVELIPAISDAGGPTPRSFGFTWLKDEEEDRRKQMLALAKDQLRAYLTAQAKATTTPQTSPHPARAASKAAKPKEPIIDNAHLNAFDLWVSNQPVLVFSAEAHMPPPSAGSAHSAVQDELVYSILLIAYPDIYNNLHKLYAGVTDKYHLDVAPHLELVDSLDADGDGRGELLFKKTSDAGTGWVIYRATADKLWKMFDSLNPE